MKKQLLAVYGSRSAVCGYFIIILISVFVLGCGDVKEKGGPVTAHIVMEVPKEEATIINPLVKGYPEIKIGDWSISYYSLGISNHDPSKVSWGAYAKGKGVCLGFSLSNYPSNKRNTIIRKSVPIEELGKVKVNAYAYLYHSFIKNVNNTVGMITPIEASVHVYYDYNDCHISVSRHFRWSELVQLKSLSHYPERADEAYDMIKLIKGEEETKLIEEVKEQIVDSIPKDPCIDFIKALIEKDIPIGTFTLTHGLPIIQASLDQEEFKSLDQIEKSKSFERNMWYLNAKSGQDLKLRICMPVRSFRASTRRIKEVSEKRKFKNDYVSIKGKGRYTVNTDGKAVIDYGKLGTERAIFLFYWNYHSEKGALRGIILIGSREGDKSVKVNYVESTVSPTWQELASFIGKNLNSEEVQNFMKKYGLKFSIGKGYNIYKYGPGPTAPTYILSCRKLKDDYEINRISLSKGHDLPLNVKWDTPFMDIIKRQDLTFGRFDSSHITCIYKGYKILYFFSSDSLFSVSIMP